MKNFEALKVAIADVEADVTKFNEGGNSSAGARVRKAMQEVKGLAQAIRVEVQEKKNKAAAKKK